MKNNSREIYSNLLWRLFERVGAQGITFIVSLVLARILDPSVYGTVALITVFTAILNVFVDSGLGNALIQKIDADDVDFSSVFFFNIIVCLILYGLMFVGAPYIACFYDDIGFIPMIRVLSLTIVISGVKNIQQAYVSKHMMFKKFFYSTLAGTIGAGIIGITLALNDFGVWAVIIQNIFNMLVDTVVLWFTVRWRPKKVFSWLRLRSLLSYGYKLLAVSLINNIYNEIRQLLIGKRFSSSDLAYYNQGNRFPQMVIQNLNTSIDNVVFSAMSSSQRSNNRVKEMTRRSVKTGSFIIAPLMIGLACISKNVVTLILTEKWLPCVPYLAIFCISYLFSPLQTANLSAIKALGRSDVFLVLDVIKIILGSIILVITVHFGPFAIAYGFLISSIIGQIVNSVPNKKLLGYTYLEQICDFFPNIILSLFMGVVVIAISYIKLNMLLQLILQIVIGGIVYILCAKVLNFESYTYCLDVIKSFLPKNKR